MNQPTCPDCDGELTLDPISDSYSCNNCSENSGKIDRNAGVTKAKGQERIHTLVDYVVDQISQITEEEMTKIYPEKNWYDDNFGANLFSFALQVTSQIQLGIVAERAQDIAKKTKKREGP